MVLFEIHQKFKVTFWTNSVFPLTSVVNNDVLRLSKYISQRTLRNTVPQRFNYVCLIPYFINTFIFFMQFLFLCNPQKSLVNLCLMKIIKKLCHKKGNSVFLQQWWRKPLKVAAFETFPISIMVLFEIHQRFKGHFLKELCFSFKENLDSIILIFLKKKSRV